MANIDKLLKYLHEHPLRPIHLMGILAITAPVGYLLGRFSAGSMVHTYFRFISPVVVGTSLGVLLGIAVGLFFGSLRPTPALPGHNPLLSSDVPNKSDILAQIRQELEQIRVLFEARKGDQTVLARIEYPMEFWNTVKASGQLFVISNATLLNTIANAYYWVSQANHLETMAFEARYSAGCQNQPQTANHLIADARLLDGPLQTSLDAAIASIDFAQGQPAQK